MRSKYQQIIKDEVRKQKLTVRAAMGQNSYLRRMASEFWSRPWADYDIAKSLLELLNHAEDQGKAARVRNTIETLVENHTDSLSMYTKQRYCRKKIYENVDNFFTSEKANFTWNQHYKVAIHCVRNMLKQAYTGNLKSLKIRRDMNLTDVLSTDDTAMGFLLLDSKKKDNPKLLIETALRLSDEMPMDGNIYAIFTRVQIGGGVDKETGVLTPETFKAKDRAVMGVDGAMSLVEATIAKPFTAAVMTRLVQYAGAKSPDEINDSLQQWHRTSSQWTSIDYSKFDQTVPSWLIKDCFNLIKEYFPDNSDKVRIDWLCHNFIHSRILYYDGTIRTKHKGISSGSQFTQIVGSLANMIMVLTYLAQDAHRETTAKSKFDADCWRRLIYRITGKLPTALCKVRWEQVKMMVMGDDNIVFLNKPLSRDDLARYLHRNFGVTANAEKTVQQKRASDYPEFLKRVWYPEGAYRNVYELILNMLLPERSRNYDGYTPWEIIYGYTITYPLAFRGLWTEYQLLQRLGTGIEQRIQNVSLRDLPGSLRVLMMTRPYYVTSRITRVRRNAYTDSPVFTTA